MDALDPPIPRAAHDEVGGAHAAETLGPALLSRLHHVGLALAEALTP